MLLIKRLVKNHEFVLISDADCNVLEQFADFDLLMLIFFTHFHVLKPKSSLTERTENKLGKRY